MNTDTARRDATGSDDDFILTIDDALERYASAGLPRTPRSVQRYCAKGHLQCRRVETSFGDKYLITPGSVEKHIAYIKEITPPTSRDLTRPVATIVPTIEPVFSDRQAATSESSSGDMSRQVATGHSAEPAAATGRTATDVTHEEEILVQSASSEAAHQTRYLARLEGDIEFLRAQIDVKDCQIKDLTERARETNHLIGGLQHMLSPLLGNGDRQAAKRNIETETAEIEPQ